jgi:hypothetical protein
MLLTDASAFYVGGSAASAVYLGSTKVWPLTLPGDYPGYDQGYGSDPHPTPATAKQTLFGAQTPVVPDANDNQGTMTLGTRFSSDIAGKITAFRFYRAATAPTLVIGGIYRTSTSTLLKQMTYGALSTGWNTVVLDAPVDIIAGADYVVAYQTNGPYTATTGFFNSQVVNGHLTGKQGIYMVGGLASGYPTGTFQGGCYFVDVEFTYNV